MVGSWDAPIKDELRLVDEEIARSVQSRQPLLTEIAMHVVNSGGKRLRPGVSLLSFRSVWEARTSTRSSSWPPPSSSSIPPPWSMMTSMTARILRRGRSAAYRKYGAQKALIAGDFLFVKGFRLGGTSWTPRRWWRWWPTPAPMAESEMLQIDVEQEVGDRLSRPI